jgi:N-acetylneuraminate synthase
MKIKLKPPYLIGEVGINHNGSVQLAKKIIRVAKKNNFDAIKLQKRDLKICIPKDQQDILRDTPWGRMTYLNYKKKIELSKNDFQNIIKFCKKVKIDIFCSAFDVNSLKFLKQFKFRYNKIPSAMITNIKFIDAVAKERKKTFISTGMCEMKDIIKAVKIFKKHKCKFVLMHCVSEYPCPENNLNLNMITSLKKKFKCEVGYSGHETSVSPSIFSWIMGATYIERHITTDRSLWGTDQAASIEPQGMAALAGILKKAHTFFGSGRKRISLVEQKMLKKFKYW